MPTLLDKDGFKFFFYANEHLPRHVHVVKADGYAKIELFSLQATENYMKPADLKKALAIAEQYRFEFGRKWDEYFYKR